MRRTSCQSAAVLTACATAPRGGVAAARWAGLALTAALVVVLAACGGTPAADSGSSGSVRVPGSGGGAGTGGGGGRGTGGGGGGGRATATALAGGAASAMGVPGGSGPKVVGGTLTVGVQTDVESMDPNRTSGVVNQLMWFMTHDLLLYEDQDKKLAPGLAESWEVSSDGKEYTFRLRKDARFQDGGPVDAEAVKFMFDRIIEKDNTRALAFTYMGGDNYEGSTVVDSSTVKFRMKAPNQTLLTRLTRGYFSVNSPRAVREMGNAAYAKQPVGSGPFIFREWAPGSHLMAEKWPDYAWPSPVWNEKGPAYLDKVVFRIIPEHATRAAALETGQIDVAQELAEQDLARIMKDGRLKFLQAVQQGISANLALNTEKPPTNELAVRQAINHAINRPALVKTICFDIPPVAKSILTASTYGYDASLADPYPFDPGKAKALLDGAGWKAGPDGIRVKDGQRLVIVAPAATRQTGCSINNPANNMLELVQAQLKDVGIEMKIELLSGPAASEFQVQGRHNAVASGAISEDPDAVRTSYHSLYIGRSNQPTRFRNARFDEVLEKQYAVPKGTDRLALLKEMQQIVADHALIVPLYNAQTTWAMKQNVEGVWIGSANYYAMFRYAWIRK